MTPPVSFVFPLPVEITNTSPAWLPWLPVLGSFMVAAAAFFGVIVSNRTNQRAIAASDDREHKSWRNNRCLDAVASMLEHSLFLTVNISHMHGQLILSVRDYAYSGVLGDHTDEFFFRRTHPTISQIDAHLSDIHSAEAVIDAIAQAALVESAAKLSQQINAMIEAEREAVRFYYLLMCMFEQRGQDRNDPNQNTKEKIAERKKREEDLKESWLQNEAAMHRHCTSAISAQKEFTRAFRQYVAKVEDHPLEHLDRSRRVNKKEKTVDSAGPFTEVMDNSTATRRSQN